jgi:thiamine kinase-like enzyme
VDTHTAESRRLLDALHASAFQGEIALAAGTTAIASPMRLATEWAGFSVTIGTRHYYAKVLYEDMFALVDAARSGEASGCAAEAGTAPDVRLVDAQRGVLLFDALPASDWRWARVDDLMAPERLQALWTLKRKVHQGPAPHFLRSPGDDIQRLRELCRRDRVSLPADAAWIDECVDLACAVLQRTQTQQVPIHGDGAASNVMIRADGEMRLIDFDRGGCFDPWYDVATTLNDLFQFEDEWRAGIAAWAGRCEEADYARCRLYALIDDWYWTLSASWSGATSSRQLEFTKLGQWTLLRCRQSVYDARFENWLRQLRGVAL